MKKFAFVLIVAAIGLTYIGYKETTKETGITAARQETWQLLAIATTQPDHSTWSPHSTLPSALKTVKPANTQAPKTTGLRPEFKAAMDAYESFYQEYCTYLKKLADNPTDMSILSAYVSLMEKAEETDKAFDAWKDSDLNDTELAYYLDVQSRVLKMASELID